MLEIELERANVRISELMEEIAKDQEIVNRAMNDTNEHDLQSALKIQKLEQIQRELERYGDVEHKHDIEHQQRIKKLEEEEDELKHSLKNTAEHDHRSMLQIRTLEKKLNEASEKIQRQELKLRKLKLHHVEKEEKEIDQKTESTTSSFSKAPPLTSFGSSASFGSSVPSASSAPAAPLGVAAHRSSTHSTPTRQRIQDLEKQLAEAEHRLRLSRLINGGTKVSTTSTAVAASSQQELSPSTGSSRASRDDWRRFSEEKRDMTRRFNNDRAALAAENHRMRLALSGKPPSTKTSDNDKQIIRLSSELSSERMLKKAAEVQVTELALQLHNLSLAGSLAVESATAVGERALGKQLERAHNEIEALRRESQESDTGTSWKIERGELMSNWNVSGGC
jgi:hypothetical protein